MTQVEKMKFKQAVERVLHVQGNYKGGILEMTLVLDYEMPFEELESKGKELIQVLKGHSKTFQNVRLNLVKWKENESIKNELSSMGEIQMGRGITREGVGEEQKELGYLLQHLKLFHARSKLIILLSDGNYCTKEKELIQTSLQPFLYKKLILTTACETLQGRSLLLF